MVRRSILIPMLGCAIAAHASPRSDPTAGRAVFTGATLADPTSIALNPAALGADNFDQFMVAVSGVLEQLGVDRELLDDSGALVAGPRVRDTESGGGAQLAAVWHPGSSASLGLDLRLPPPELFPNDPALRYHSLGTRQRNFVATAGTSLKLSSLFYFGFGISHDVSTLHLRYARDAALDGNADCGGTPCGFENPAAAELYDVRVRSKYVSTENLKLNIGVMLHVTRDIWLGVAYHNTPGFGIQSQLDGTMAVTHAPRDGGARVTGESTVYVSYPASVDSELRARILPDLDLHMGGRWEDLSRMQAYDVRGYGIAFRGQNIPEWVLRPRGFHDSVALWAGFEQVELEAVKLRVRLGGRVGVETSSLQPDRTAPGTVSPNSVTLDGGAHLRLASNWVLRASYGVQLFQHVDVKTSEYDPRFALECRDSGFDYTTRACEALRNGYAIPTAEGQYSRIQHALRLALSYERP